MLASPPRLRASPVGSCRTCVCAPTYRTAGKKVVFKTGPMKSRYGKLHRTSGTPTISIYTKKPNKDTYVDCYRQ